MTSTSTVKSSATASLSSVVPVRIASFAVRKIIITAATLLVLALVVFTIIQLTPGDPAVAAAGPGASEEQIEQQRRELGLDGSFLSQLQHFLARLLHGDLGTSTSTGGAVRTAIADALPSTFELVVVSLLLSVVIAVPLAGLAALKKAGRGETLRRFLIIFLCGLPTYWLALMAQWIIGGKMRLFPISGQYTQDAVDVPHITGSRLFDSLVTGNFTGASDALAYIALPATVLSMAFIGPAYRVIRTEFIAVSQREYVTVSLASGQSRHQVMRRNIYPHILTPTLVLIGVEFGTLFGGAVLVETIFGRGGLGSLLTNAVAQKDINVVIGGVLVIGVIVVITNLVVDILQVLRDPRLRSTEFGV
jgi:dipeptide transport system permease protein